jgi:tripartite-type tricarboxylate transporter receptor subunit TctC
MGIGGIVRTRRQSRRLAGKVRSNMNKKQGLAVLGALSMLAAVPAQAQSVAPFYSGKTISIVVGAGEGGGYSFYGQLAGEYLRKLLPGNPTVIVQSMPGAGGIKATDYLANVAPKDGTALGMLLDLAAATQMLQPRAVRYDLSKFSVVGSFVTDNPVVMVRADAGVSNFAEFKGKPIVVGASGKGSQTWVHPALLKEVLGANLKLVTGYKGSADISLALERNEVQAQSATWVSWKARHAEWIRQRQIIPIVQVGLKKEPELPDVPLILDLPVPAKDRPLLAFMARSATVGRPLATTPGVPADRVAALRRAFEATVRDLEFIAAAAKEKLDVRPQSGDKIAEIIIGLLDAPIDVRERMKVALTEKGLFEREAVAGAGQQK